MLKQRIVADPPAGWEVKESVTFLAPDQSASFIVSSEPIPDGIDSGTFADRSVETQALEFPGYEPGPLVPVTVFGEPGFLHYYSWTPAEGRTVSQAQVFAVVNGRSYTTTATAAPWSSAIEAQLLAAIASLRLTNPSASE